MILRARGHLMNGFNLQISWTDLDNPRVKVHENESLLWMNYKGDWVEILLSEYTAYVLDGVAMMKLVGE